jgi:hypothetical protein
MQQTSKEFQIEQIPGNKYPDRAAAQRAARPVLAADLANTLRSLLEDGRLINVNGRIIPNPERIQ